MTEAAASVHATEEDAWADAEERNRALRGTDSPYYYVAAWVRDGEWRVERRGGPVGFRELLRRALRPWSWGWWPWNA